VIVAVIYVYGLVLELPWFGMRALSRGESPGWEWWQYLLAPFMFGLIALVAEGLFTWLFPSSHLRDKERAPWKTAVLVVSCLVLGALLLIGPWWLATLPK
jgi:hypothetical protein